MLIIDVVCVQQVYVDYPSLGKSVTKGGHILLVRGRHIFSCLRRQIWGHRFGQTDGNEFLCTQFIPSFSPLPMLF